MKVWMPCSSTGSIFSSGSLTKTVLIPLLKHLTLTLGKQVSKNIKRTSNGVDVQNYSTWHRGLKEDTGVCCILSLTGQVL